MKKKRGLERGKRSCPLRTEEFYYAKIVKGAKK